MDLSHPLLGFESNDSTRVICLDPSHLIGSESSGQIRVFYLRHGDDLGRGGPCALWHAGPRGGEGKGREPPFSSPPHPTHPPAPTRACTQDKPSTFPRRTPPLPLPPSPATSLAFAWVLGGKHGQRAGLPHPPSTFPRRTPPASPPSFPRHICTGSGPVFPTQCHPVAPASAPALLRQGRLDLEGSRLF